MVLNRIKLEILELEHRMELENILVPCLAGAVTKFD